jgi:predicted PurR-regulated permease PerM
MSDTQPGFSPSWGWTTKLIVGLTLVAIIGWLVVKFQNFLGPLLLVFILAYMLYPLAKHLSTGLKIPWRLAVSLIYLVVLIVLIGLLTLGGLALVNQLQSLINFLQQALVSLPTFIQNLTQQVFKIGPFQFALAQIDLNAVSNQILAAVQPLLGQVGGILGIVATSAASMLGWTVFILVVSYFILVESEGIPASMIRAHVPGYDADIKRLGVELSRIWNAFLRGQLIITGFVILVYAIMLSAFGLPFALGLAAIAGISKFIPYIGSLFMWTTYGLVSYFQGSPPLGLHPIVFAIIVVGCAMLVDSITDNLISPRIMAQALKVHPAAVLIAALIGLSLLGLIGVVMAAPVLATVKLFSDYIFRKMLDQDPWQGMSVIPIPPPSPVLTRIQKLLSRLLHRVRHEGSTLFTRLRKRASEKH